ncbi:YciI family protein [Pantoea sp. B65]|uniref:YciI family protein n=1 Tax=Pantoea sp. B65 TaxID=2813359 RepID=UPI0039B665B9
MQFILRFYDRPERLALRQQYLNQHLAWLAARQNTILAAGSLRPDADAAASGAVWIVEAESFAAASQVWQSDPFWIHGLREQHVEVMSWNRSVPDKVLI